MFPHLLLLLHQQNSLQFFLFLYLFCYQWWKRDMHLARQFYFLDTLYHFHHPTIALLLVLRLPHTQSSKSATFSVYHFNKNVYMCILLSLMGIFFWLLLKYTRINLLVTTYAPRKIHEPLRCGLCCNALSIMSAVASKDSCSISSDVWWCFSITPYSNLS